MKKEIRQALEEMPFVTWIEYLGEDLFGIIQNADGRFFCMYILNDVKDLKELKTMLTLAHKWWYTSNRKIPINLYFRKEWKPFKKYLKVLLQKDVKVKKGPVIDVVAAWKNTVRKRSVPVNAPPWESEEAHARMMMEEFKKSNKK